MHGGLGAIGAHSRVHWGPRTSRHGAEGPAAALDCRWHREGGKGQDDPPFSFEEISKDISKKLLLEGYEIDEDFIIQLVPNITNITYGRGVGYIFEQESFDLDIESISATKIRKNLRDEGKIK